MHRALIVARMKPDTATDIAETFAASDRGELPRLIGVTGRSLFQFGDLYLHLIEAERPPGPEVAKVSGRPEFRSISEQLAAYVHAYDPQTWRGPEDAMAREFYRWERDATT
jgi:cyclase